MLFRHVLDPNHDVREARCAASLAMRSVNAICAALLFSSIERAVGAFPASRARVTAAKSARLLQATPWLYPNLLREPEKKLLTQNADLQWGHIWNVLELSCKVIDGTEDGLSQTRDARGRGRTSNGRISHESISVKKWVVRKLLIYLLFGGTPYIFRENCVIVLGEDTFF